MPVLVNKKKFYRTSEACALVGISRMTFLRWVREGHLLDVSNRDWKGWRLFTDNDIDRMKLKVDLIQKVGSKTDES